VPASSSLSIAAVAEQLGHADDPTALPRPLLRPVEHGPSLREALASVVDPRHRRGVRHGLVVVLTAAVCAVAAGARSFVAIAEWVADLPAEVAAAVGTAQRCPSESTIRRLRVLAIDGKTLRGSRHHTSDGEVAGRHLFAVIDQHSRVVLGQLAVDVGTEGKASEIDQFAPLLDTIIDLTPTGDLTGVVITADALHTQRAHVADLHARGAHWVLTVKGNQPTLRRQLAALPWRGIGPAHRSAETGHGRREIRTLKILTVAVGIAFPHARQAIQITRRTRPVNARTGKPGRWRTETVYAITDLAPHEARPDELAGWIRGHWQIENALHWVRDTTYAEDLSQARTGAGPQVMASLRNLAISLHRLTGATNIAKALRHHARNPGRPLELVKIN
jgi:predicted transposase YbfD/YdcC